MYALKFEMRVLIVHTKYKLKGGEDSVVANELELLKNAGIEVDLLEFDNDKNTLFNVLQLPFNIKSYNIVKRKITTFKPDIIHVHNLHFAGSPSVIYAAKRFKIPVVLTLHNYRLLCPSGTLFHAGSIYTNSLNQNFPIDAIFKGVYHNSKILTFWVGVSMWVHQLLGTWKLVDKYIVLTSHTKEIFSNSKLKDIIEKMVIKPNFCFGGTPINKLGQYYLYVGRLSEEKGINVMLDTFKENMLKLRIAGAGPLEDMVKTAAKENSNITYLGNVNKQQVTDMLNNATALIFPSQWYETFGMVIIEAFAAGIPVIASNIGHLKLTIKSNYNGLHFISASKDDLNEKLAFFENYSKDDKTAIKVNALNTYSSAYTPALNIQSLLDIYGWILAE